MYRDFIAILVFVYPANSVEEIHKCHVNIQSIDLSSLSKSSSLSLHLIRLVAVVLIFQVSTNSHNDYSISS